MGKTVIAKGKTVEEAVANALEELGVSSEETTTKVLEVPSTGFMGIGGKSAKVEVSITDNYDTKAKEFLSSVLAKMGINTIIQSEMDEEEDTLYLSINLDNIGVLIGKHGQTLDALQYLTSIVANKGSEKYIRVILDINDYRAKRKKTLERLADKMAKKVISRKQKVELEPMNPYERRIIHAHLQSYEEIETFSEGEGMTRHLIITYIKK